MEHLSRDSRLRKVLATQDAIELSSRKNIPLRLCASIMSQQLSVKVAKVIYERFLKLFNKTNPTPQEIAAVEIEELRSIGLSNAKAQYIHNVAQFCLENKLSDARLRKMSDEDIIALLTQIKGVGRWTVEMLLMFTLGREDVFALDDYGIQTAMKKLYKLEDVDKKQLKEKMLQISAKWSPYRTYACLHLWQWKDGD